jgi:hypothetical protein
MLVKRLTNGAALLVTLACAPHAPVLLAATEGVPEPLPGTPRDAYVAGKRAPEREQRRALFARGVAAARALLARDPDDPEGLLWLAANLGAEALERGKLSALRALPEMERLLLRLEARAPLHDHAAAARTLGRLYHKAPALISIGSMSRARDFFERALARAADYPPNQVLAADFFADAGDADRARALARAYLAAPAPEDLPDASEWRRIATRIAGSGR